MIGSRILRRVATAAVICSWLFSSPLVVFAGANTTVVMAGKNYWVPTGGQLNYAAKAFGYDAIAAAGTAPAAITSAAKIGGVLREVGTAARIGVTFGIGYYFVSALANYAGLHPVAGQYDATASVTHTLPVRTGGFYFASTSLYVGASGNGVCSGGVSYLPSISGNTVTTASSSCNNGATRLYYLSTTGSSATYLSSLSAWTIKWRPSGGTGSTDETYASASATEFNQLTNVQQKQALDEYPSYPPVPTLVPATGPGTITPPATFDPKAPPAGAGAPAPNTTGTIYDCSTASYGDPEVCYGRDQGDKTGNETEADNPSSIPTNGAPPGTDTAPPEDPLSLATKNTTAPGTFEPLQPSVKSEDLFAKVAALATTKLNYIGSPPAFTGSDCFSWSFTVLEQTQAYSACWLNLPLQAILWLPVASVCLWFVRDL